MLPLFTNPIVTNNNKEEVAEKNRILGNFFNENYKSITNEAKNLLDFSACVFQNCVKMYSGSNIMVSPFSLLCALGMVLNGADGETKHEMEKVLGISSQKLNHFIQDYKKFLTEESTCKLESANAIYVKKSDDVILSREFLKINETYYAASVFQEPFDQTTVNKINSWVYRKTDGMIGNILDSIDSDCRMLLINALAFNSKWMYRFSEKGKGKFTALDGTVQCVKMMHSKENIYLEDDETKGFIKFYSNPRFSFVALLPNKSVSIVDYVSKLTGEKINHILSTARNVEVETEMPVFNSDSSINMKVCLEFMGILEAFSNRADFSKMGKIIDPYNEKKLAIDEIRQKTHICVDENGTKAAAVTITSMGVIIGGVSMPMPLKVILDRPFVYMIIDHKMNLPIFMGVLMSAGTEKL